MSLLTYNAWKWQKWQQNCMLNGRLPVVFRWWLCLGILLLHTCMQNTALGLLCWNFVGVHEICKFPALLMLVQNLCLGTQKWDFFLFFVTCINNKKTEKFHHNLWLSQNQKLPHLGTAGFSQLGQFSPLYLVLAKYFGFLWAPFLLLWSLLMISWSRDVVMNSFDTVKVNFFDAVPI